MLTREARQTGVSSRPQVVEVCDLPAGLKQQEVEQILDELRQAGAVIQFIDSKVLAIFKDSSIAKQVTESIKNPLYSLKPWAPVQPIIPSASAARPFLAQPPALASAPAQAAPHQQHQHQHHYHHHHHQQFAAPPTTAAAASSDGVAATEVPAAAPLEATTSDGATAAQ